MKNTILRHRAMNERDNPDESGTDRSTDTVRCGDCGAIGYPDDKYCVSCGSRMRNTCSNCDTVIRQPVAWFCPQCGHPLFNAEAAGDA